MIMDTSFYALVFRQRYIKRWGLMRNVNDENLAEHSAQVAMIAHALALIGNKYFGKNYRLISRLKPGVTGLWQVSGRSETNYERRVALNMYYLKNWSMWLDYYIFLKTIIEVAFCRGAK